MKKVLLASLALLLLAFFALPAMADVVAGDLVTRVGYQQYDIIGLSTSTGPIQLFVPPAPVLPPLTPPDLTELWGNNNTSTLQDINVPGSPNYNPDYVPSGGEAFDIEAVLWRYNPANDNLHVWVVTSIGPTGVLYNSSTYMLGDVFLNADGSSSTGVGGYDYALISFDGNPTNRWTDLQGTSWDGTGRNAGDLVMLDDALYGINGPNSYVGNTTIRAEANPWAVSGPDADDINPDDPVLTSHDLVYEQVSDAELQLLDHGASSGPTFVYFFDVFVDLSDAWVTNMINNPYAWHVTVQCGNDESPGSGGGGGGRVPVPGALILGIIGAGLVGLRRRMKA